MEFGNPLPYDIVITGSNNKGFIVKTGCCTSVFTNKKVMLAAIEDYINDPKKAEKDYNESTNNCRVGAVRFTTDGTQAGLTISNRHEPMEERRCDCQTEQDNTSR